MLDQFNLKQKLVLVIIIVAVIIGIGIYGFISMSTEETELDLNEILAVENIHQDNQEVNGVVEKESIHIIVHITGEVNHAGVFQLSEGARVADAIEAAGGATKEADLESINLAYILADGQKIYIPNKKDKENNEQKTYITTESGDTISVENNSTQKGVNAKVNINTANQSELETLPGIGPSLASKIIEYREQNGKFNSIEELKNVKGIGDARFEDLKDDVII